MFWWATDEFVNQFVGFDPFFLTSTANSYEENILPMYIWLCKWNRSYVVYWKYPCNIIFSDVWPLKWQSAFYLFWNACMLLMLQSSLANLNWLLGKWTKRKRTRLLASAGSDRPAHAVGFRCSFSEPWNRPNCFQAGGSSFQLTCEFVGEVTMDKLHLRSSENTWCKCHYTCQRTSSTVMKSNILHILVKKKEKKFTRRKQSPVSAHHKVVYH